MKKFFMTLIFVSGFTMNSHADLGDAQWHLIKALGGGAASIGCLFCAKKCSQKSDECRDSEDVEEQEKAAFWWRCSYGLKVLALCAAGYSLYQGCKTYATWNKIDWGDVGFDKMPSKADARHAVVVVGVAKTSYEANPEKDDEELEKELESDLNNYCENSDLSVSVKNDLRKRIAELFEPIRPEVAKNLIKKSNESDEEDYKRTVLMPVMDKIRKASGDRTVGDGDVFGFRDREIKIFAEKWLKCSENIDDQHALKGLEALLAEFCRNENIPDGSKGYLRLKIAGEIRNARPAIAIALLEKSRNNDDEAFERDVMDPLRHETADRPRTVVPGATRRRAVNRSQSMGGVPLGFDVQATVDIGRPNLLAGTPPVHGDLLKTARDRNSVPVSVQTDPGDNEQDQE